MAHVVDDRIQETTTTTGTGALALNGATTNFRRFSAVMATGDTCAYAIVDATNNAWETGLGTYSAANTLTRTTVWASSNTNAAVSFAAGTKTVFITQPTGAPVPLWSSFTPPTAEPNTSLLFAKNLAGRHMPAFVGPNGLDTTIQPHVGRNAVANFRAVPGATTITGNGMALTAVGTATAQGAFASTNMYTSTVGVEFLVTTAATTAVAGFRAGTTTATMPFWRGNAANMGGFHVGIRAGVATGTVSTARFFMGLQSSTAAPTDVDPSTLTNVVGVGYGGSDTNFQVYFNSTGTATKVDTGIAKSAADRTNRYDVTIFCPPNGSFIGVTLTNLTTGVSFTTQNSANIPAATVFMGVRGYHSVGGTSSVTGFGLMSVYTETDT